MIPTGYKAEVLKMIADAGGIGKVVGSRVLVKDVQAVDEIAARAKAAGLAMVTYEQNVPKPTEGIVLAVGSDPLIQEEVQIGDHIFFSKFAGHNVYEEGQEFRSVELQEITRVKARSFYGWKDDSEANNPTDPSSSLEDQASQSS